MVWSGFGQRLELLGEGGEVLCQMPAPARAGPDVSQEPGFQPEGSIGDTQIPDLSSTASKDAH